jgi:rhomboid protease GluP
VCRSCGTLVGVRDERCYQCGARNPGLWGYAPLLRNLGRDMGFVSVVTAGCVGLYVIAWIWSGLPVGGVMGLDLLPVNQNVAFVLGASGAVPVYVAGRWWTLLSAAWLHANLLHLLFNMYALRQLAPPAADLYGPGRIVIIYTVAAITGFGVSTAAALYLPGMPLIGGGRFTLGASAPIFGLIGALVYYARRSGSSYMSSQLTTYAITMFVFGLMMRGVDNAAHAGGFLGGWIAGRMLDPLKPERIDHLVAAIVCLVLSVLSIAASVVEGYRLLQRG